MFQYERNIKTDMLVVLDLIFLYDPIKCFFCSHNLKEFSRSDWFYNLLFNSFCKHYIYNLSSKQSVQ